MFVNRVNEINRISEFSGALMVIFGRRRVGKTTVIKRALKENGSVFYSQAVEAAETTQLEQIRNDTNPLLPDVPISSWTDFFKLLSRAQPATLVLDEFPYLVKTQPSLPSIIQKFLDHSCPEAMNLIVSGSSQTMMHDIFLSGSAPLYERASDILHLKPMNYKYFCEAKKLDPHEESSYLFYSVVGGVPKYWEFLDVGNSIVEEVERLFFESGSRLEYEPERLLKDENIVGEQGKAILEIIGRGAHRPSEIAKRLGVKQTSLSKPLQLLRNSSLVERQVPFGTSERDSKKSLYKIEDHVLLFWYSCFSPHRTRWFEYANDKKIKLIRDHASRTIESDFRSSFRYASPYWESNIEFDSVRPFGEKSVVVSEIKFRHLSSKDREKIRNELQQSYKVSALAKNYEATFDVLDFHDVVEHICQ